MRISIRYSNQKNIYISSWSTTLKISSELLKSGIIHYHRSNTCYCKGQHQIHSLTSYSNKSLNQRTLYTASKFKLQQENYYTYKIVLDTFN